MPEQDYLGIDDPIDPILPIGQQTSLGVLGEEEEEEDPNKYYYDLFQLESQAPVMPDNTRLQEVYGTGAMPTFEWVRSVLSGRGVYDPNDPDDQVQVDQYNQIAAASGGELPNFGELYATTIGNAVGGPIAGAIAQEGFTGAAVEAAVGDMLPETVLGVEVGTPLIANQLDSITDAAMRHTEEGIANRGILDRLRYDKPTALTGNQTVFPEIASKEIATRTGNLDAYNTLNDPKSGADVTNIGTKADPIKAYDLTKYNASVAAADPFSSSFVDFAGGVQPAGANAAVAASAGSFGLGATSVDPFAGNWGGMGGATQGLSGITAGTTAGSYASGVSSRFSSGMAGAGYGALASTAFGIISGQDPVEAADNAIIAGAGALIGQAVIPIPVVGGMIGSFIATKIVGGRVICNELVRQGLMDRRHVILDYKFTKEHLTPQHVNGYHVWAVHVVKKLRAGKRVRVWKHLATHRANEIAYIYGERDRPDYLGKVYRHIGEPICWVIGAFCEKTNWSVLYNPKEI